MFFLVHGAHVVMVCLGVVVVAALLWPGRGTSWRRRPDRDERLAELRRDCANGALIEAAETRAATRLAAATPPAHTPPAHTPPPPLLVGASVATLLAASLHVAVSPEHFAEALRLGVFFTVLSIAQVCSAVALLKDPSARLVSLTVVLDLTVVALWVLTRTVGLPFDLAEVESVGLPDSLCTAAEVLAALCCVAQLRRVPGRPVAPGTSRTPADPSSVRPSARTFARSR